MNGEPIKPNRNIAYLGLGTNVGDRERNLRDALRLINEREDTDVVSLSQVYETEPVGYLEQPAFLNMACRIETSLEPAELLKTTLDVERRLGRERLIRWGPRTIDIDMLLFNNVTMDTTELTLPHPRLLERPFVLIPLRDVMPDMEERLGVRLQYNNGDNGVRVWTTTFKPGEFGHFGS
jgi:2-amino-4-hydroxy-6-hydroxymethyldihydropteridine diphosphokinase